MASRALGALRQRLARLNARAASAIVKRGLRSEDLAPGVTVGAGVSGADRAELGGENDIGSWTVLGDDVKIGYGTTIGVASVFVGPVRIGEFCQLGPHVTAFGSDHPLDHFSSYTGKRLLLRALRPYMPTSEIEIGNGVWIGANVVIVRGTTIGNGSVVGAGSVVRGVFPPNSVIVGNPARVVRERLPADLAELVDRTKWWSLRGDEQELLEELVPVNFRKDPDRARAVLHELLDRLRSSNRGGGQDG